MTITRVVVEKKRPDVDIGLHFESVVQIDKIDSRALFGKKAYQLKQGMQIISINGVNCDGKSPSEIHRLIRAAEGTVTAVELSEPEATLLDVALSTIGWTSHLWPNIREKRCFLAAFYFCFFILDLADAVFDLILSIKTIIHGSDEEEGAGLGLGTLLFVTTILGRIISGLYGYKVAEEPPPEDEAFFYFALMEMAVFFLEDGAAILVLANSTGEMDLVERISMYLTMVCGICYIGYFVLDWGREALKDRLRCTNILFMLVPASSAAFQGYIMVTQVLLSKDEDDVSLSGVLEIAALIVYGVTAFIVGGFAALCFTF